MGLFWTEFLFILSCLIVKISSDPRLLKIPKVYNALVTSDQNLLPSRAYPVLQPVLHRTAVGYVPPFYYGDLRPNFYTKQSEKDSSRTNENTNDDHQPLTFYPNLRSLYYNPYFYGYYPPISTFFNRGVYYFNNQLHAYNNKNNNNDNLNEKSRKINEEEKEEEEKKEEVEENVNYKNNNQQIPNVPPPPLPTKRIRV